MIKNYTRNLVGLLIALTALVSFNSNAQTTLINPLGDGGFNNGNTFAANGWTVANQGVNPSKWVVGTAVSATTTASAASAPTTPAELLMAKNTPGSSTVAAIMAMMATKDSSSIQP